MIHETKIAYSEYRKLVREEARQRVQNLLKEEDDVETGLDASAQSWVDAKSNEPFKAVIAKTTESNEKSPINDQGEIGNGWSKVSSEVTITNPNSSQLDDLKEKRQN